MSGFLLCGAVFLTANSICTSEIASIEKFKVKDLHQYGHDTDFIIESYSRNYGIELDWWDEVRVTPKNEGESIDFTVFENFVVTVSASTAVGAWNKSDPR